MGRAGFDNDGDLDVDVSETFDRTQAADLLASLKSKYEESERKTGQAAAEYRKARQRSPEGDPKLVELRALVAGLVRETFEHRQRAQQMEAEILRQRQHDVDARLAERQRLKEQIINRRFEELVNPDLSWEEKGAKATPAPKGGPSGVSALELYQRGKQAIRNGDSEQAVKCLLQAIQSGESLGGRREQEIREYLAQHQVKPPTNSNSRAPDDDAAKPQANGMPDSAITAGARAGSERNDNELHMTLVWCPPGTFTRFVSLGTVQICAPREEFRRRRNLTP